MYYYFWSDELLSLFRRFARFSCIDPLDFWIDTNNWVFTPPSGYNGDPPPNPAGWGPVNYTLKSLNPGFDDPNELFVAGRTQINMPELDGRYCHPFDYPYSAVCSA
jgi:hypothetical protein